MSYRETLTDMLAKRVDNPQALQFLSLDILELNYETLEDARQNLYQSGVTLNGTAALAKAQEEMGVKK